MKKYVVLGMIAALTGCNACQVTDEEIYEPVVAQAEAVIPAEVAVACSSPCVQTDCCAKAEIPVLKPRVTEIVSTKKKRPCCVDENDVSADEGKVIIPDIPELYAVSANRAVNSMQIEAAPFFEKIGDIKVFVDKAEAKSADLPGGLDKGTEVLKKRFSSLPKVTVVAEKDLADFVVSSRADWYDTATKTIPAIKYDLLFKGSDGHLVGQWSEILHQAEGDKNWW